MSSGIATFTTAQLDKAPPWLWPRAAYIHIPFCAHHCGYCDFAVTVGQDHVIDRYIDALIAELALLQTPQTVRSIFIGGGTPAYLSRRQLDRLLTAIQHWLPLETDYEFSIEANPSSLDADKVAVLAEHGVNRVSVGAQSFQLPVLRVLERDHQPDDVPRAIDAIKQRIAAVSIDLIFGVPGQTLSAWRDDLTRALAFDLDHISTYSLTYEKGTRLWKQRERGGVTAVDEGAELAMYEYAIDHLAVAGFEHYEISNFAQPGMRSRHNSVYWANEAYFGFGMGAFRYVNEYREANCRDIHKYIKLCLAGRSATCQSERLEPEARARETLFVQLRRAEGVDRLAFRLQTGLPVDDLAGAALSRHIELGLIIDDGASIRLTRKGKCLADAVIRDLL